MDLLRSVEGQVENNGDWEGENIVSNMWECLSFEKDQNPNILKHLLQIILSSVSNSGKIRWIKTVVKEVGFE